MYNVCNDFDCEKMQARGKVRSGKGTHVRRRPPPAGGKTYFNCATHSPRPSSVDFFSSEQMFAV